MESIKDQVRRLGKRYAEVKVIEAGGRELIGVVTAVGERLFTVSRSERDHCVCRFDRVERVIPRLSPKVLRAFRERFALSFEETSRLTGITVELWQGMEDGSYSIPYKLQPILRSVGRKLQEVQE